MVMQEMVKSITDSLTASTHVNAVFGEPRMVGRKTIIPIATVGVGFGAGGGEGKHSPDGEGTVQEGSGAGGGGGGAAKPLAILEVTEEQTKIIPIIDTTKVILASLAFAGSIAFMIAKIVGRRK